MQNDSSGRSPAERSFSAQRRPPEGAFAIRAAGERVSPGSVTGTGTGSRTAPVTPPARPPRRSPSLPRITRKLDKGLPQHADVGASEVFLLSRAETRPLPRGRSRPSLFSASTRRDQRHPIEGRPP